MAYNFNTQPQYQQQQAANNNMPQFQQQNIQPLFPQPQGNVCQITSRRRYSTKVFTNIQNGVFKLLGPVNCFNCKHSGSLPITTTTETTG